MLLRLPTDIGGATARGDPVSLDQRKGEDEPATEGEPELRDRSRL